MKRPAPRLKKCQHLPQIIQRAQARSGIKMTAGMCPAGIALFHTGSEHHYFVAPFRPARRPKRNAERKAHIMKGFNHAQSLRAPRRTAPASIVESCASDLRKDETSGD